MLSPEDIAEFKELYRKVYGEELSDEEAALRARNLIQMFEAVYGPGDWHDRLEDEGDPTN